MKRSPDAGKKRMIVYVRAHHMTFLRAGLCVLFVVLLTTTSMLLTGGSSSTASSQWYADRKPWWTPPSWVFPWVWTVLYAGLAVILYVASGPQAPIRALLLPMVVVNLLLNAAWSPLFFRLRALLPALLVALAMLATAIVIAVALLPGRNTTMASAVAAVAAWAYVAWLALACSLNAAFLYNANSASRI